MQTFSKPIVEIIRQRYSCRTYLEQPIERDLQRQLTDFAAAPGTGPLGGAARFQLVAAVEEHSKALRQLGTYGFIKGATGYLVGATQDGEEKLEDFDYMLEKLILFATGLGLGTCWLGGTFTKSSFAQKIDARPDELIPSVTAVGYVRATHGRLTASSVAELTVTDACLTIGFSSMSNLMHQVRPLQLANMHSHWRWSAWRPPLRTAALAHCPKRR